MNSGQQIKTCEKQDPGRGKKDVKNGGSAKINRISSGGQTPEPIQGPLQDPWGASWHPRLQKRHLRTSFSAPHSAAHILRPRSEVAQSSLSQPHQTDPLSAPLSVFSPVLQHLGSHERGGGREGGSGCLPALAGGPILEMPEGDGK